MKLKTSGFSSLSLSSQPTKNQIPILFQVICIYLMELFIIFLTIADLNYEFKCHQIDFDKNIFVSTLLFNREFLV
jgi:hypothetical protein